jgi:FKBP-type peptidyl-prolyl cis-trans isomerase FklB
MKLSIIPIALLSLVTLNSYAATDENQMNGNQAMTASVTDAKTTGDAFLAANKNKPDVVTLPDGLQYKILIEGSGPTPTENDKVTVHYSGTLINGSEFDSSYKRGQPATFPVMGVIPGWVEALKLMKVGSTWELYIPSSLAYGKEGAPPAIGPNETLIFKVELLGINK